jgi:hypothetical protein
MFEESLIKMKNSLDQFIKDENDSDIECRYQIIMPYVLRGIMIHLLFDYYSESKDEFIELVSYLELIINSKRENSNYFERYLIQLSSPNFLKLV